MNATRDDVVIALRGARDLISDPKRWIQGSYARNDAGLDTGARALDAVCWCADGALDAVACGVIYEAARTALFTTRAMPRGPIGFNDTHTHQEVLDAFDFAITQLEAA